MYDTDDLTGLLSRAAFMRRLQDSLAAAALGGYALCLLLVDLDYLKSINDHYGHLAGDGALRATANVLGTVLRGDNAGGRYGGDEFVVLLPAATREEGLAAGERLRAEIAHYSFKLPNHPASLRLSLSIGVAASPQDGSTVETLFAAADRGVYAAKAAGRNCVRAAVAADAVVDNGPRPVLQRGRLVGREAELRRLRTLMEAAQEGIGNFVVLEGEAGIGKTRLTEELVALAGVLGLQVLQARCHQVELASPYHPFLEALGAVVETAPTESLVYAAGVWTGELTRLLPALGSRLSRVETLAALPPDEDRMRLQQALCHFLTGIARSPLLLVIDDAHWADEASIRVLNHLAWQIDTTPMLVVCTVRSTDLADNVPLVATLDALERQGRHTRIELAPLGKAEVSTLLRMAVGLRWSPDALQSRLIEETGGNPLFLLETVRLLIEQQVLREQEGQWCTATDAELNAPDSNALLPLAPTVQTVIEARLARLTEANRAVLSAAAVLGRRFDPDSLVATLAAPSVYLADSDAVVWTALEELERQRLIAPAATEGTTYEFVHPLIRQVAYQSIGLARQRALHRRAGAALAAQGAPPGELAEHYWQGALYQPAIELFAQAAAAASAVHAVRSAIGCYERALAASAHLPAAEIQAAASRTAELYEHLGDARDLDGDWEDALVAYEEAMTRIGPVSQETIGARARLWCKIGDLRRRRGELDQASEAYDAAMSLADEIALPVVLLATALLGHAYIYEMRAAYADAAGLAESAREMLAAAQTTEPDLAAQITVLLGTVARRRGDLATAAAWFTRGLEEAEAAGLLRWVAHFQRYFAIVVWQQGNLDLAQRCLRHALDVAERIGDQHFQARCQRTLGVAASVHGQHAEAIGWYRRSLAICERTGDWHGVAAAHHNLGHQAHTAGDFAAARASYQQSLALREALDDPAGVSTTLNIMSRLALDAGDFAEAEHYLERSSALAEAIGDPSPLGHCLLQLACLCLERGDSPRCLALCERVALLQGADPEDLLNADLTAAHATLLDDQPGWAIQTLTGLLARAQAIEMAKVATDVTIVLALAHLYAAGHAERYSSNESLQAAVHAELAAAREAATGAWDLATRHEDRVQQGKAARLRGQASATWEEAAHWLRTSLNLFDQMGAVVEAARTRVELALHPGQLDGDARDRLLAEARHALEQAGAARDIADLHAIVHGDAGASLL